MDGRRLRVDGIPADIPPSRVQDELAVHFLRSKFGGVEVKNVDVVPGAAACAIVTFHNDEVVDHVLKIEDHSLRVNEKIYDLVISAISGTLDLDEVFERLSLRVNYKKFPEKYQSLLENLTETRKSATFDFDDESMTCTISGPYAEILNTAQEILNKLSVPHTIPRQIPAESRKKRCENYPEPLGAAQASDYPYAPLPGTAIAESCSEKKENLEQLQEPFIWESDIFKYLQQFHRTEYWDIQKRYGVLAVDEHYDDVTAIYLETGGKTHPGDLECARSELAVLYRGLELLLRKEKIRKSLYRDQEFYDLLTTHLKSLYPTMHCHADERSLYLIGYGVDVSAAKRYILELHTNLDRMPSNPDEQFGAGNISAGSAHSSSPGKKHESGVGSRIATSFNAPATQSLNSVNEEDPVSSTSPGGRGREREDDPSDTTSLKSNMAGEIQKNEADEKPEGVAVVPSVRRQDAPATHSLNSVDEEDSVSSTSPGGRGREREDDPSNTTSLKSNMAGDIQKNGGDEKPESVAVPSVRRQDAPATQSLNSADEEDSVSSTSPGGRGRECEDDPGDMAGDIQKNEADKKPESVAVPSVRRQDAPATQSLNSVDEEDPVSSTSPGGRSREREDDPGDTTSLKSNMAGDIQKNEADEKPESVAVPSVRRQDAPATQSLNSVDEEDSVSSTSPGGRGRERKDDPGDTTSLKSNMAGDLQKNEADGKPGSVAVPSVRRQDAPPVLNIVRGDSGATPKLTGLLKPVRFTKASSRLPYSVLVDFSPQCALSDVKPRRSNSPSHVHSKGRTSAEPHSDTSVCKDEVNVTEWQWHYITHICKSDLDIWSSDVDLTIETEKRGIITVKMKSFDNNRLTTTKKMIQLLCCRLDISISHCYFEYSLLGVRGPEDATLLEWCHVFRKCSRELSVKPEKDKLVLLYPKEIQANVLDAYRQHKERRMKASGDGTVLDIGQVPVQDRSDSSTTDEGEDYIRKCKRMSSGDGTMPDIGQGPVQDRSDSSTTDGGKDYITKCKRMSSGDGTVPDIGQVPVQDRSDSSTTDEGEDYIRKCKRMSSGDGTVLDIGRVPVQDRSDSSAPDEGEDYIRKCKRMSSGDGTMPDIGQVSVQDRSDSSAPDEGEDYIRKCKRMSSGDGTVLDIGQVPVQDRSDSSAPDEGEDYIRKCKRMSSGDGTVPDIGQVPVQDRSDSSAPDEGEDYIRKCKRMSSGDGTVPDIGQVPVQDRSDSSTTDEGEDYIRKCKRMSSGDGTVPDIRQVSLPDRSDSSAPDEGEDYIRKCKRMSSGDGTMPDIGQVSVRDRSDSSAPDEGEDYIRKCKRMSSGDGTVPDIGQVPVQDRSDSSTTDGGEDCITKCKRMSSGDGTVPDIGQVPVQDRSDSSATDEGEDYIRKCKRMSSGDGTMPDIGQVSLPDRSDSSAPDEEEDYIRKCKRMSSGDGTMPDIGQVSLPDRSDSSAPDEEEDYIRKCKRMSSGDGTMPDIGQVSLPDRSDSSAPDEGEDYIRKCKRMSSGDGTMPDIGQVSLPDRSDYLAPDEGEDYIRKCKRTDKQRTRPKHEALPSLLGGDEIDEEEIYLDRKHLADKMYRTEPIQRIPAEHEAFIIPGSLESTHPKGLQYTNNRSERTDYYTLTLSPSPDVSSPNVPVGLGADNGEQGVSTEDGAVQYEGGSPLLRTPAVGQDTTNSICSQCKNMGETIQTSSGQKQCVNCFVASVITALNEAAEAPVRAAMSQTTASLRLPGYEQDAALKIIYEVPDGVQRAGDPQPGCQYRGGRFEAYLPDNPEGRKLLSLLQRALDQGLIFQVKTFETGEEVTWYKIPHKTSPDGGKAKNGYPDTTYVRDTIALLHQYGID